jgi:hypothetical protein
MGRHWWRAAWAAVVPIALVLSTGPAWCGPAAATPEMQNVFGFAGGPLKHITDPADGFEDNVIVGIGYQQGWTRLDALMFGWEAGLAGRFGQSNSLEGWAGLFARYDIVFNGIRVAPAVTFGLSAVTDTMAGGETERENDFGDGDATLLFYLGPELSVGLDSLPNVELFARIHHRSGAWGTLGEMHGGLDVVAIGVRSFF